MLERHAVNFSRYGEIQKELKHEILKIEHISSENVVSQKFWWTTVMGKWDQRFAAKIQWRDPFTPKSNEKKIYK